MNKKMGLILGLPLLLSFSAYADTGEKTNCRTVITGKKNIYSGPSSCRVEVNNQYYTISQFVPPTTSSKVIITELIRVGGMAYAASCWANVPYHSSENILKTVCDYKPVAKFTNEILFSDGLTTMARFTSTSTDHDGNIASYKWFIDGVNQNKNSRILNFSVNSSGYRDVKLTVTDNDGYSTSYSKRVNLSRQPTCGDFC